MKLNKISFSQSALFLLFPLQVLAQSQAWDWRQSVAGSESYVGSEVFLMPWGNNRGQIPKHKEKIGTNYGSGHPEFWNNQYCLAALFIGDDGSIYVFSDSGGKKAFRKMSRTGRVLSEDEDLGSEGDLFGPFNEWSFNKNGYLETLDSQRESVFKINIFDGKIIHHAMINDPDFKKDKAFEESMKNQGLREKIVQVGSSIMGKFAYLDPETNKTLFEISEEKVPGESLDWVKVIATDKEKNIYVIANLSFDNGGSRSEPAYLIYKYSIDGTLLTKIKSQFDNYYQEQGWGNSWVVVSSLGARIAVDGDGNIYQLHGTPKGLELYKWTKK